MGSKTVLAKIFRKRNFAIIAIGLILAVSGIFAAPSVALADTASLSPASQTAEYGHGWNITGTIAGVSGCDSSCLGTMKVSSGSESISFSPSDWSLYPLDSSGDGDAFYIGDYLSPQLQLGVGTHSVTVSFSGGSVEVDPIPAVQIIVTPTAVSATTVVSTDPNNVNNAIVSAQLNGNFIQQLPNCYCEAQGQYNLPAATWNLQVTNGSGKVVLSKEVQQASAGEPYFVYYWQNVPRAETFTAVTNYTITGAASLNFTMSSQKFSYTSGKQVGSGSRAGESSSRRQSHVKPAGFGFPLWLYMVLLLVGILIAALDAVLIVRWWKFRAAVPVATTPAPEVMESVL